MQALEKQGVTITTLGQLLARPLQNGVFKKPDNVGRGHKLINVYDLYADTTVDLDSVESLEVTADEVERYSVAVGDVFFTRSSLKPDGIAWAAYLDRCKEAAVFECHIIRARLDQSKVVPGFLTNYARSWIARQYLIARAGVTTMATIDQGGVEELPIVLPSKGKQIGLLSALDTARATRRAKLAEADALLAGLDDFLLTSLGLTPPLKDERKVFAVSANSVPGRFDPHFYLPELMQNLRMLKDADAEPLGTLVSFSDEVWKPSDHDQASFRYIEISGVKPQTGEAQAEETPVGEAPSRARMALRSHDIIVSLTRPHHGSIAQITPELNGCVASTGFSVLRNVSPRLNREYLWCVLRTKMCLKQMLQRASGGNYPAITELELAKVLVPIPALAIQDSIATEARRRREEARRLRGEAEVAWQEAKQWFEEQLLGPAQS